MHTDIYIYIYIYTYTFGLPVMLSARSLPYPGLPGWSPWAPGGASLCMELVVPGNTI